MPVKLDFLKECMTETGSIGRIPIDEFNLQMCRVCAQRECSRSALNNSAFDVRARNWKIILFDEVPRAQDTDNRFDNIRSKNFRPIQPKDPMAQEASVPYEIKEMPIQKPQKSQEPAPPVPETPPVVLSAPSDTKEPVLPENPPLPNQESTNPKKIPPKFGNTAFQQGSTIQSEQEDTIIQPGGSFTFEE